MRFLIDNQLPVALARFLSSAGSESLHVFEVGLSQAPDSEIWRYAAERQFVLVSKDLDFFHRAAKPGATGQKCRGLKMGQPAIFCEGKVALYQQV